MCDRKVFEESEILRAEDLFDPKAREPFDLIPGCGSVYLYFSPRGLRTFQSFTGRFCPGERLAQKLMIIKSPLFVWVLSGTYIRVPAARRDTSCGIRHVELEARSQPRRVLSSPCA